MSPNNPTLIETVTTNIREFVSEVQDLTAQGAKTVMDTIVPPHSDAEKQESNTGKKPSILKVTAKKTDSEEIDSK